MKGVILAGLLLASTGVGDSYHWVTPPAGSAAQNVAPSTADVTIPLGRDGSRAATVSTGDGQLTLILIEGLFPFSDGASAVRILIEPVDPATITPPQGPFSAIGNVYRIRTFYIPGNAPAPFTERARAIFVYPLSVASAERTLTQSTDGAIWEPLGSTDTIEFAQMEAEIASPGYLAVAGRTVAASPVPRVEPSGLNPLIVAGLVLLAVVAGAFGVVTLIRDRLRRAAGRD